MLVGHFAVGLAAKRVEPELSVGTLVFAAMLADVVAFSLVAAGIERFGVVAGVQRNRLIGENVVYSHSLLMDILWAALLAGAYFFWRRHARAAWLLFAVVVSHWVLDVISHRPDMPVGPGIPGVFGLGLWNSLPATLAVEGGMWLFAIVLYVSVTRANSASARYAFWARVVALTLAWFGNISRPPTPGGSAVAAGLTSLVFFACAIGWAYWMEHARALKPLCLSPGDRFPIFHQVLRRPPRERLNG